MPLSSEEALQIVTLVLLVCLSASGVACIVYVFHFRLKILHGNGSRGFNLRHLRDFNAPWLLRVMLCGLGALWLLLEILRLPLLRNRGWAFHGLDFEQQASVCRSYLLLTLGIAEPGFFLTALFLVRESLHSDPFNFSRRRWRYRSVCFIAIGSLLAIFFQLMVVVLVPSLQYSGALRHFSEQKEGFDGAIPRSFTMAFVNETRTIGNSSNTTSTVTTTTTTTTRSIAACRVPLLSSMLLSIFALCYVAYFLFMGWKMVLMVINRRLRVRVYCLLTVVAVMVPLQVLLLGLSSSAMPAHRRGTHEVVAFLRFLAAASCVVLGEWMLVVRPISDAISVLEAAARRGGSMKVGRLNSWGAIPVDQFSLSLTDEDNRSLITEISVELAAAPMGEAAAKRAAAAADEEPS